MKCLDMNLIDENTVKLIEEVNLIIGKWKRNDIIYEEWNDYDPKSFTHLIERVELGEIHESSILFHKQAKLIKEPVVIGRTFQFSGTEARLGESHSLSKLTIGQTYTEYGRKKYISPSFSLLAGGFHSCVLVPPKQAIELMRQVAETQAKDIEKQQWLEESKRQKIRDLVNQESDRDNARSEIEKILQQLSS